MNNGYLITSDGLIFQWGAIDKIEWQYGTAYEGWCDPIPFPIPFPNKVLNVQISVKSAYPSYHDANGWPGIVTWTNTSFTPYVDYADGNNGSIGCFWMAMGY